MGLETGDPVVQYYFRLNDLLYRSSAVLSDGFKYLSLIERRLMDVWEPVPGTDVPHDNEKKAVARARKLTDALLHTPLIYLAYWVPPEAKDDDNSELYVRITSGPGQYLYNIGDYMIRPDGPLFSLHRWDGVGANAIGEKFFSLEAATIAAVIKARTDAKEKARKEAMPTTPTTVVTMKPIEQEVLTDDIEEQLRRRIDDLPDGQDAYDYDLGLPTDRD